MPNKYSYEYALQKTKEYFDNDELAAQVAVGKYLLKDDNNTYCEATPYDMHQRIIDEFLRIENKYKNPISKDIIKYYIENWIIVPQGSPLSAIGNNLQIQSTSNCFVIQQPYDSYGGILRADEEEAQIMKRRGGVGVDISTIRPKGLKTKNAAMTTDGIGVFMERYSNTCREVAQGGRRGALMITCDVEHPDIMTFISIKLDKTKVTGANITVKLSDEFMKAVESDSDFVLRWPTKVSPELAKFTKTVRAKEIWDHIINCAWESAEPGISFWDTYTNNSPADIYSIYGFGTISTNPCGEIGLCAYDSCRLILQNLVKFVKNPFKKNAKFDYDAFYESSIITQRLMDDLVDLEIEKIDQIIEKIKSDSEPDDVKSVEYNLWNKIKEKAILGRRTGSGITALGDAMACLGIKYGSKESIEFTEKVYKTMALGCYRSTVTLAKERGAFPIYNYDLEKDHIFINRIMNEDETLKKDWQKYGRRNIALTTTAPAGSVSILTQTSSGIEPVYMLSYKRRKKINQNDLNSTVDFVDDLGDKWQEHTVYHHYFKKWMNETGNSNVEDSPYYKATANDIEWINKVDIQAVAQKWLCHSISNTLNLPNDVSKDVINDVYFKAWKQGCKGVTVYRDGSRSGVLVSGENNKKNPDTNITLTNAPKRPKELDCHLFRTTVNRVPYIILVGLLNGLPYEVFAGEDKFPKSQLSKNVEFGKLVKNTSKNISTYDLVIKSAENEDVVFNDVANILQNTNHSSLGRMISTSLRHGVPINFIVEQLRKDKYSDLTSFSSVIARIFAKHYISDGTKSYSDKKCNECGGFNLVYQDGCVTCMDCGYSKCA